jgi:ubiquitin-conjugating enzyme E2 O
VQILSPCCGSAASNTWAFRNLYIDVLQGSSGNQVGSSTENNSLKTSGHQVKFDGSKNEEEDYYIDDEEYGCYDDNDEGSDHEIDTADFNQQLTDKFDGLDLPPGVEATVPWLLKAPTDEPGKYKSMKEIDDEIAKKYNFFKQFDTVEDFSDHHYATKSVGKVRPRTHICLYSPDLFSHMEYLNFSD